jgi:hypothetical protein
MNPMFIFVGYDENCIDPSNLTTVLLDKVTNDCRIVLISGITGSGKTVLAESLTAAYSNWSADNQCAEIHYSRENFTEFHTCHMAESTTLVDLARYHLNKHGEDVPRNVASAELVLSAFVDYLEKKHCWILVENLEEIVGFDKEKGTYFKDRAWMVFFERLLSLPSCKSRIILTSRVLISELTDIGGKYPDKFCQQPMPKWTREESAEFFRKNIKTNRNNVEVSWTEDVENAVQYFFEASEGYPAVLSGITRKINDSPYYGNIAAYYKRQKEKLEDFYRCRVRQHSIPIIRRSDTLIEIETLNDLFKKNYPAYHALCQTSTYGLPISEEMWLGHMEDCGLTKEEGETALQYLQTYLLIEEKDGDLRQQNIVRYFAQKHLHFPLVRPHVYNWVN